LDRMAQRWIVNICPFLHFDNSRTQTYERNISIASWNVKSVLDYLDMHENHKFCLDQLTLLEGFKRLFPNYWDALHQRVLEGRIEIVGGTYVMPDFPLSDGESIVRQFMLGVNAIRSEFGVAPRTGWGIDSAGHCSQLPQILRLCGIDSYFFWRGMPFDAPTEFVWRGADGSKVNAVWLSEGFDSAAWLSENVREAFSKLLEIVDMVGDRATSQNVFIPVGGELVPPLPHLNDVVEKWNETFPDMRLDIVTASEFSSKIKSVQAAMPMITGPLCSGRFAGVRSGGLSSRILLKMSSRRLEGLLYLCELYLCQSGNGSKGVELDNLWRILLFNQDHNISRGTIADEPYLLALRRYKQAIEQAEGLLEDAISSLSEDIRREETKTSFVVFNPVAWTRTDVVRTPIDLTKIQGDHFHLQDANGREVPFQIVSPADSLPVEIVFIAKDMPSLGHRVYSIVESAKAPEFESTMKIGDSWAESSDYLAEFDTFSGALKRLFDKEINVEVVGGPANYLTAESDVGDLYRFSPPQFLGDTPQMSSLRTPGKLKLIESGPIRCVFEVTSEFDGSPRTDRISLYEGIHRVDFELDLDFRSRNKRLRLNFPIQIFADRARVGAQFGSEWVGVHAGDIESEDAHDPVLTALDWIDCTGPEFGVLLSAPGLHEFRMRDGVLRTTILRSVDFLSYGLDDDVLESRTARDNGPHSYRYTLHSHSGDWSDGRVWRVASEHRLPLIAYPLDGLGGPLKPEGSSISVEGTELVLSSVRPTEKPNQIILRLYEPRGTAGKATLSFARALERIEMTDALDQEIGQVPTHGNSVELQVDAHSIITLKVLFKESGLGM
jgi:alpha-mannosidase